jgi:hypothetical protein
VVVNEVLVATRLASDRILARRTGGLAHMGSTVPGFNLRATSVSVAPRPVR